MKKDTFLKGAVILSAAGIIVRILGAFFRIPLGNIITSEGMGYFQVGQTILNIFLAFTAAGFPTAISKLVSEKRAIGDDFGAHKVFKNSFYLMLILGVAGSVVLLLITPFLVNNVFKSPNSYFAAVTLAPSIFFVSVLAAFRGYFQGMKDMKPTALSQVVEQIGRVGLGLFLAIVLLDRYNVEISAGGASLGTAAGGFFGLVLIIYMYKKNKRKIHLNIHADGKLKEETFPEIISSLMRIAIPIAIGAAVMPLINIIDTFVVLRRLQATGFSYEAANSLFGQLQGMASALINLPQVITVALAMSIVPVISESATKGDWIRVKEDTKIAFKAALLIGLPASIGLAVLANPIMNLLFPREPDTIGRILLFLSFAVLFLTLIQILTGILQGLGKPDIPVKNLAIGAVFKFAVTYGLTGLPWLNVKGAAIGTVVAYFVAFVLNFLAVKKELGVSFEARQFFIKPLLSAIIMGIVVFAVYRLITPFLGWRLATVAAIPSGGLVYGIMLLKTGTVIKEDFGLLPGGEKVFKLLAKLHLIK